MTDSTSWVRHIESVILICCPHPTPRIHAETFVRRNLLVRYFGHRARKDPDVGARRRRKKIRSGVQAHCPQDAHEQESYAPGTKIIRRVVESYASGTTFNIDLESSSNLHSFSKIGTRSTETNLKQLFHYYLNGPLATMVNGRSHDIISMYASKEPLKCYLSHWTN
jgi:hypothetical protein